MFKKKYTRDQRTQDRSNFYTVGKLGKTRELTPEGYLLCRDVALAHTGALLYGEGEVPVTADAGLITITRGEDDLFRPETMASFEGKPITNDHPEDWVTPDNWKELSKGVAQNIRRGEGLEDHLLIADLLVQDKDAIEAIQNGKVEISLGYDADYTEISKGKGIQSNIIGNHVALVDKGRCGTRCSIGDSKMGVKAKHKTPWYQALLGAKRTIDEALEEAEETTDSEEETKDDDEEENAKTADAQFKKEMRHFMKTVDSRFVALEKKKTKDADESDQPTEDDDDEDKPTEDDILEAEQAEKTDVGTTYTGDSLQDLRSRVEILAPGLKLPTLDSTSKTISKVADTAKRNALKRAYATADGAKALSHFIGGTNVNIDALPTYTVDAAFIGASELIKQQNNLKGVRTGITTRDFGRQAPTPADINAKNRAFWSKN